MVSANVPSAKKIIVHGPDLTSIPSQFPVHEVSCILKSFWELYIMTNKYIYFRNQKKLN